MKKILPIKFYQKREVQDERKNNASGSKTIHKWILEGEELVKRSNALASDFDSVIEFVKKRTPEFQFIPSVITVDLNDKSIAKSHRGSIKDIFNQKSEQNIIGLNDEKNILIKINSIEDASIIKNKITDTSKYAKGISSMLDIKTFKPRILDKGDEFLNRTLKVCLFNYYEYPLKDTIKMAFTNLCSENKIKCQEVYYANDLILYRIDDIQTKEQYASILEFPALQCIEQMPCFTITFQASTCTTNIDIKKPESGRSYPVVGILDGGVSDIPHLSPWIQGRETNYPENLVEKTHGTFIGGIIAYGDSLEGKSMTGVENCMIFDATVFPDTLKEGITEDELVANIREVVCKNSNIKVWNLSLGYDDKEIDSNNFSQFSIALDDIQRKYNVIFCKAAGNCNNYLVGKPAGRITVPSESIMSLVVGSISDTGNKSVFSRVGNGPASIIKPDLVSYGGDMVSTGSKYIMDGVKSFDINGNIKDSIGTSFATPRVATLVSGLYHELEEDFDPLLLKAMTIHSASYPENTKLSQQERTRTLGYGVPSSINDIIYNSENEITLVQSDRLPKGSYIEILEFPYPESLIDNNGFFYGDITITLVTNPVLNTSNGSEYCQSDIDVKFGTFDEIQTLEIKRGRPNEFGPGNLANVLQPDIYHKLHITTDFDNSFTRERTLIKYGKKYNPVKKWHISLSEATPSNKKNFLKSSRKWGLRLTGFYRDFTETRANIDGEELFQDFCLIITIKDPTGTKQVYNEVTNLLDARNFIHNDIRLNDQILTRINV
jgi:hypothetical protein